MDAANTPYTKLRPILHEIAAPGHIITKRAYGDFSIAPLKHWKEELDDNAIIPVQQFSYTQGKNSSDSAMIIDAMDLLYTDKYDAIALVTSDCDFTKLASRLRESQLYVFGVGRKQTPPSFVNACDDFIYIENIKEEEEDEEVSEEEKLVEAKNRIHKASKVGEGGGGIVSAIKGTFAGHKSSDEKMTDRQFRKIYKLLTNAYEKYADDNGWADG